uniref:DUF6824 domain-containing protein n=1 Tax=Pseudictyota dubia TaxID=2749911 RepID=A0A7R9Z9M4_9STRA
MILNEASLQLCQGTSKKPDQDDIEEGSISPTTPVKQNRSVLETNLMNDDSSLHSFKCEKDLTLDDFDRDFVVTPTKYDVVFNARSIDRCYAQLLVTEGLCSAGNSEYESKISARRSEYLRSNKMERDVILTDIVDWVRQRNGRFLKNCDWYYEEIQDNEVIKDMTRTALQKSSVEKHRPECENGGFVSRGCHGNHSGQDVGAIRPSRYRSTSSFTGDLKKGNDFSSSSRSFSSVLGQIKSDAKDMIQCLSG